MILDLNGLRIPRLSFVCRSAALPITLQCCDENVKIDPRISHFVIPLGTTINMDGTALFVAAASVFIAQMNEVSLAFSDYLTIWYDNGHDANIILIINVRHAFRCLFWKLIMLMNFGSIMATGVSIATATTPSASLSLMFIILNAIGFPVQDIGLLFSVDWFL
jgi:Na+/H+-dicarboxylate symporter